MTHHTAQEVYASMYTMNDIEVHTYDVFLAPISDLVFAAQLGMMLNTEFNGDDEQVD